MIKAKINCSAIDKAKLFQGTKGLYLDVCLIETPNDKFGNDYVVIQDVSKEEREAGKKGAILGNAKNLGHSRPMVRQTAPKGNPHSEAFPENEGMKDCPF